jgi:hypothetical protein
VRSGRGKEKEVCPAQDIPSQRPVRRSWPANALAGEEGLACALERVIVVRSLCLARDTATQGLVELFFGALVANGLERLLHQLHTG